jgi:hypothetical protein
VLLLLQAGQPLEVSYSIPCIEQDNHLMLAEFFLLFDVFIFWPFNNVFYSMLI